VTRFALGQTRCLLVAAALAAAATGAALTSPAAVRAAPEPTAHRWAVSFDDGQVDALAPLSVRGNELLAGGQPIQLRGVNRSGSEYACLQGWGVFDGRTDPDSVHAIASWHTNVVRLPLNEDCWLGINGVPDQFSGSSYQQAIHDYVGLLHKEGLYVELSLQWSAPGSTLAADLAPILDVDHSLSFWSSVAGSFRDDPAVYFGLQSEPFGIDAGCWLRGHDACAGQVSYVAAGMQEALDAVRAAGASNVVAISGINWANDLTAWLANQPRDSLDPAQVVAEAHVYGNNGCGPAVAKSCLDEIIAPLAQAVPVIFGETGETYDQSECSADSINVILPWADAHGISYLAWTWNSWGDCQSLISSEDGTPNTSSPGGAQYASYVKAHLAAVASPAAAA
jgi:endoglucanase